MHQFRFSRLSVSGTIVLKYQHYQQSFTGVCLETSNIFSHHFLASHICSSVRILLPMPEGLDSGSAIFHGLLNV